MAAKPSIDPIRFLEEQLAAASPDLLRAMLKTFVEALMSAEADAVCGAGYGERSPERATCRNGYRARDWDTRAGSIGAGDPEAARRQLCPGLAAGAAPPQAPEPAQQRHPIGPLGGLGPPTSLKIPQVRGDRRDNPARGVKQPVGLEWISTLLQRSVPRHRQRAEVPGRLLGFDHERGP